MIGLPPGTKVFLACQPIDLARRVRRPGGQGAADHETNRANGFNDRFAENQVKTLLSTAQKVPQRTQLSSSNSSIADLQAMMGTRRV